MRIACFPGDDIGDNIIAHGWYEDLLLEGLFDTLLREQADRFLSGAVVDVGANIGNHSLWFSRRFGKVLAFEPNPICARLFEANVLMNGLTNVHLFAVGLSDRSAKLMFHLNRRENIGRSGVTATLSEDSDMQFEIDVVAGDSVLNDDALGGLPLRLIKLDIEGHEFSALVGLERTISVHRPIILFESNRVVDEHGSDAVVGLLSRHDYRNYYVMERRPSPFKSRVLKALYRLRHGEGLTIRQVSGLEDKRYSLVVASPEPLGGSW